MMKKCKIQCLLLSLILLISAGCGKKDESDKSNGDNGEEKAMDISIVGGAAGASWTVVGEGIGNVIKRTYPDTSFTYQPGQDGANVLTVDQGQAQFGIVSFPAAKWAYAGEFPFESQIEDVRIVAYLHSMPYHFVVTERSGIESIEQVVKENLPYTAAVNTERSIMEITSGVVFDAYGTSYKEIEEAGGKIHFIPPATAGSDLIKDRKLDGFMSPLPTPAGYIGELNNSEPLRLLPLSDKAIAKMEKELGAIPATIQTGTYEFLNEDIPTASVSTVLIASADVSDEMVYKVTKSMYDEIDYLQTIHKTFEDMTKETMANVEGVPFHKGAEKFYKEVGLME